MTDLERRVAGRLVDLAKVVVTVLALLLLMWAGERAAMGLAPHTQHPGRPAAQR